MALRKQIWSSMLIPPVSSDLGFWVGLWLKTKIEKAWLAFLPPFSHPVAIITALCSRPKTPLFRILTCFLTAPFTSWSTPCNFSFLRPYSPSYLFALLFGKQYLSNLLIRSYKFRFLQGHFRFSSFWGMKMFPIPILYTQTWIFLDKMTKKNRTLSCHIQCYCVVQQNCGWCWIPLHQWTQTLHKSMEDLPLKIQYIFKIAHNNLIRSRCAITAQQ